MTHKFVAATFVTIFNSSFRYYDEAWIGDILTAAKVSWLHEQDIIFTTKWVAIPFRNKKGVPVYRHHFLIEIPDEAGAIYFRLYNPSLALFEE